MLKTRLQVFALLFVLAPVCALTLAARAAADSPDAADAAVLKQIADYKSWTRVTEKPVPGDRVFVGG
jgi:hypothetical protein